MAKTATVTKIKTAATSIEVAMKFKKETPGTYVYEATDEDAPITTLYVKKAAMPDGEWKSLTITAR